MGIGLFFVTHGLSELTQYSGVGDSVGGGTGRQDASVIAGDIDPSVGGPPRQVEEQEVFALGHIFARAVGCGMS